MIKYIKKLYHRIRRYYHPSLYWTQEQIDRAKEEAKILYEFFKEE